jgi:hypothetical protein
VRAWLLTEGDQALGGETILLLHRDALSRTITVVWDSGHRATLDGDGWVVLARRAFAAGVGRATPHHWYDNFPMYDPPMTARSRYDARRRLDDCCREHRPR